MLETLAGILLFVYFVFGLGVSFAILEENTTIEDDEERAKGWLILLIVMAAFWPSIFGYKLYKSHYS